MDNLNIEDPFVKEIIEIWSETFFEKGIVSKDHFLSLPLAKFTNKDKQCTSTMQRLALQRCNTSKTFNE